MQRPRQRVKARTSNRHCSRWKRLVEQILAQSKQLCGFLKKVSGARCNSINQRGYRRIPSHRSARAHCIGRIVAPRNIHFAQKRTQFLPSHREQRTAENEPRTRSFAQRASRQQACRRVDSSAAPEREKQSFRTIVGLMSEQHMGCVARGREVADRSKSRVSRSIKRISAARHLDAANLRSKHAQMPSKRNRLTGFLCVFRPNCVINRNHRHTRQPAIGAIAQRRHKHEHRHRVTAAAHAEHNGRVMGNLRLLQPAGENGREPMA